MDAAVAGIGLNRTGGKAILGDPFNASGDFGAALTFAGVTAGSSVPEPSALVLVLAGIPLIGVFPSARRRRIAHTA